MTTGVIFIAENITRHPATFDDIRSRLRMLSDHGWKVDSEAIGGRVSDGAPSFYWSEPFHDVATFGVFEAPSAELAQVGIDQLMRGGWGRVFEGTQWIVGKKDLAASLGRGPHRPGLGFLALWDWNDEWHAASEGTRREYDADCDVAFDYDVMALGSDIFGRYDTSAGSEWDHVALWEVANLPALTEAMHGHEVQHDFMFTTSHHLIGRPMSIDQLEEIVS